MIQKYTQNGISFSQLKKYAKKLKKETELTSQQALNSVVSQYTSFSSWEKLNEYDKSRENSFCKLKFNDKNYTIYNDKPFLFLENINYSGYNPTPLFLNKKNIAIITENSIISQWKKIIDPETTTVYSFHDFLNNNTEFELIYVDELHIRKSVFEFLMKLKAKHKNTLILINCTPFKLTRFCYQKEIKELRKNCAYNIDFKNDTIEELIDNSSLSFPFNDFFDIK